MAVIPHSHLKLPSVEPLKITAGEILHSDSPSHNKYMPEESCFEALILNSVFLLQLESICVSALLMTLTALFNQNYNMFACCSDRFLRLICISWICPHVCLALTSMIKFSEQTLCNTAAPILVHFHVTRAQLDHDWKYNARFHRIKGCS